MARTGLSDTMVARHHRELRTEAEAREAARAEAAAELAGRPNGGLAVPPPQSTPTPVEPVQPERIFDEDAPGRVCVWARCGNQHLV